VHPCLYFGHRLDTLGSNRVLGPVCVEWQGG